MMFVRYLTLLSLVTLSACSDMTFLGYKPPSQQGRPFDTKHITELKKDPKSGATFKEALTLVGPPDMTIAHPSSTHSITWLYVYTPNLNTTKPYLKTATLTFDITDKQGRLIDIHIHKQGKPSDSFKS